MATEAKTKPPPDPPVALCDRHLTRAPGPGRYDLPSEFGPNKRGAFRWSMPGKPRQERREDPTPGPDKYAHPRTSFGGTRPTMAARFTYRDREDYNPEPPKDGKAVAPPVVKSTLGGAKFSFGGRVRQIRPDVTPGPGHCDPLAALKFTSQKVPAFSMGSKYRTLNRDPYYTPDSAPKDGKAVNPPAVKGFIGGGPKYSMGGKTSRPRDDVMPGQSALAPHGSGC